MPFESIKKLLTQKIGLNPNSIGESSIDRAIRHRINAIQAGSVDDYLAIIKNDNLEFHELIEEVVVPETWFFRNRTPFEALRDYMLKQIVPNLAKDEKIRILSLPCSTGEEPYSIAISLAEANIQLHRVEIDAVDVSKRAVIKAKRAIYGKHSFRGVDPGFIDKYFNKGGAGHKLVDEIKQCVNFRQGNFLIGSLSPHVEYYHAIFCRNLLIYFDRDLQKLAFEKIHRSLKTNGVLFVGHAETSQVSRNMFARLQHPHSFGFVKSSGSSESPSYHSAALPKNVPEQWRNVFEQIAKIPRRELSSVISKEKIDPKSKPKAFQKQHADEIKKSVVVTLETIERHANEGRYSEAQRLCEEYIKMFPSSAKAYYLMALITDSSGNGEQTETLLKKAIYLDPNNEAALILSGLLAEKKGDMEAANSYKRRAERVSKRKNEQAPV